MWRTVAAIVGVACLAALLAGRAPAQTGHAARSCSGSRAPVLLCLMNATRAAHGVRSLRIDGRITRAARQKAHDMVARQYFDHVSPSGGTLSARIAATGWMRGRRAWSIGENLAWGSGSRAQPAAIVQAWMDSPPHRRNLLDGHFSVVGLGVADGTPVASAPPGATFVADFGS